MRLGIVVGLAAEARIARRSGWPVAIGGGSTAGAEAAARRLLAGGADALVSFGLAGGLDPALHAGDRVVPEAVVVGNACYRTDARLALLCGGTCRGVLAGIDVIAASAEQKRRLQGDTKAVAADMESGAVARVASELAVPFTVQRAICDPADLDLPSAALVGLNAGAIAIGRVIAALAAHPRELPALLTLAAAAAAARRTLRDLVRRWPAAPLPAAAQPRWIRSLVRQGTRP